MSDDAALKMFSWNKMVNGVEIFEAFGFITLPIAFA